MWLIVSGAMNEKLNNPNYYNHILNNFPRDVPSPYEDQIKCVRLLYLLLGFTKDISR